MCCERRALRTELAAHLRYSSQYQIRRLVQLAGAVTSDAVSAVALRRPAQ